MHKKLLISLLLSLSYPLINSTLLFAQEKGKLRLGIFEVHPGISFKELYDSNIFSEANGSGESPDHDFISTLTPSIDFKYPGKLLTVSSGYSVKIERYAHFTNENTEKHEINSKLQYTRRIYDIELTNRFTKTKDPASDDTQSNADLNRANRMQNAVKGSVDVKFGRYLNIVADASNEYNKYKLTALDAENSVKNEFGFAGYYKLLPKASLAFNYHYGTINYQNALLTENSSSTSNKIRAGISLDPTAKISGEATFGYETKNYKESNYENSSAWSVSVDLSWLPQKRTKVGLIGSRRLEESSYGTNSASYTITSATLKLNHKLTRKFTVEIEGGYTRSDYESLRNDYKIQFKSDLKYNFREWFFISINYSFKHNNSSINDKDYEIHQSFFNVGANL